MEWQKSKDSVYLTLIDNTPKDITEKWLAREKEIDAWREEELQKAWAMFIKVFHHLWD